MQLADPFFAHYSKVKFNGSTVTNLTERAVVSNTSLLNPYQFYPVTIAGGTRSDQFARKVHNDPSLEWVVFMSNKIIDPYNEWYMDQSQFTDFINQKYGDVPTAQERIKNYKNNWLNAPGLSLSGFDALDPSLVKYFNPTYDGYGLVNGYVRKQEDWYITTNHFANFTIGANSIPLFVPNEKVTITYHPDIIGQGQVASSLSAYDEEDDIHPFINIQHVSGFFAPNGAINIASFSITGQNNNTLTLSNSNELTYTQTDGVSAEEEVFYSPVYWYDWEFEKNESNKHLQAMINGYIPGVSANLKALL